MKKLSSLLLCVKSTLKTHPVGKTSNLIFLANNLESKNTENIDFEAEIIDILTKSKW